MKRRTKIAEEEEDEEEDAEEEDDIEEDADDNTRRKTCGGVDQRMMRDSMAKWLPGCWRNQMTNETYVDETRQMTMSLGWVHNDKWYIHLDIAG